MTIFIKEVYYKQMTVAELIKELLECDPNAQVMILDSFNRAGSPREINLTVVDIAEFCDCEEMEPGNTVIVLGFGCY